ncbi:ATP-dependent DNA helicase Q4 [Pelobates fuscus]|uniref:ATP-dependent DNA helicase Q4 n=1 Tax=Pelobates fuscus TaxID=191477 RepID=UPI002FE458BC
MQRHEELKLLLKKWEAEFLEQHQRKPNKVDLDNAPEETKAHYKEYRTLKHGRDSDVIMATVSLEKTISEHDEHFQVPSSWGNHLNRSCTTPKSTPKLTLNERDSLKASAQYFGMKLKAKLGGSLKERPLSMRKSFTPCTQSSIDPGECGAKKQTKPSLLLNAPKSTIELPPDTNIDHVSVTQRLLNNNQSLSATPHNQNAKKFNHLQTMVGQRLASLNPDWLQRCALHKEGKARTVEEQFVIMGGADRKSELHEVKSSSTTELISSYMQQEQSGSSNIKTEQTSSSESTISPLQCLVPRNKSEKNGESMCKENLWCFQNEDNSQHSLLPCEDKAIGHGTVPEPRERKLGVRTSIPASEDGPQSGETRMSEIDAMTAKICGTNRQMVSEISKVGDLCEGNKAGDESLSHIWEKKQEMPSLECRKTHQEVKKVEPSIKGKRKRKMATELGTGELSPDNCKKKRKTKPISETKKTSLLTTMDKKNRAHSMEPCEEVLCKTTSKRDLKMEVSENILGDVEEEDQKRMVPIARKNRGPNQGTAGNFVRINLKRKSHVKGYALNGSRLRKQMWKQKWQKKGEQFGGGGRHFNHSEDTCFRCGKMGHWSSQCPGTVLPQVLQDSDSEEADVTLPTLEDVAKRTNTCYTPDVAPTNDPGAVMSLDIIRPVYEPPVPPPPMQPLYGLGADGKVQATPAEVYNALSELGFSDFRPGQEEAVMRILSGLSSLVILSTGMGKSLCYQLPAYMYAKRAPCITLVISPLVSLMDDQVSGLPSKLKAVCIHSNMTRSQRDAAIEKVKEGQVHVLLLSPEALVGGGHSGSSCLPPADQLPPVAFACIDEAHCVSEWSHNFRPCYLRLCKVLRERLGVHCLLGLTATATRTTAHDVAHHLGVTEDGGIPVRIAAVPSNLHLSVSMDRDKDKALVNLLKGERFGCLDSVIVYCTRREETTRISALLRTCLQGVVLSKNQCMEIEEEENTVSKRKKAQARKKIRRPLKWVADSYHAGMSAAERRRVQNNFMSGQLRLVVATVAFGMGLDKSDVRGIIHYNMPKNFESYVQEIGRAGRDGKEAQCHLYLDPEAQDLNELRRHVYGDSVDYFTIKRLVQRVFPSCKCRELHRKRESLTLGCEVADSEMLDILDNCEKNQERVCNRHERAIPIEDTVQALDVREEGIETLLCYLELHTHHWLELLHPTLSACRVTCYSGPQHLRNVAKSCPPVAVALARERLAGVDHSHASSVEFNVVELADSMGWEIIPVKRALRELQWRRQMQEGFRGTGKSGVLVEFSKLSFHFHSYGDLTDQELEEICDFLYQKVSSREKVALSQLKSCYNTFRSVAYRTSSACAEQVSAERSSQLKSLLLEYFEKKDPLDMFGGDNIEEEELIDLKLQGWKDHVCSDVRHFLSIRHDERFSARAIARIFHGIGIPCYPAQVYGRDRRFWRKYIHLDFNKIMQLAKEEIIHQKL